MYKRKFPNRPRYWIRTFIEYCPLCGRENTYWRERVYGEPKPKEYDKRYVVVEQYDWCEG